MTIRRLKIVALLVLALLAVAALGGWHTHRYYRARMIAAFDLDELIEASGDGGKVKTAFGEWFMEGEVPFFRKGYQITYMPVVACPGKSSGPVCLLIIKLVPKAKHYRLGSSTQNNGKVLEITTAQLDSKGQEFHFKYQLVGETLQEQFSAGGQSYSLEAGRVFLVDLCADPPQVVQLQHELKRFAVNDTDVRARKELEAVLADLASRHETARSFLAKLNK